MLSLYTNLNTSYLNQSYGLGLNSLFQNTNTGLSLFDTNSQQPAATIENQNNLINLLIILFKKTFTQPTETTANTQKFVNRYTKNTNYVDPGSYTFTIEEMDTNADGYITDDEFKTYKASGKWVMTEAEYKKEMEPGGGGKNTEAGMAFIETNYDLLKQSTLIRKQEKSNTQGFTRNLAGDGSGWISTDGIEKMNEKYKKMFKDDNLYKEQLNEQVSEKYQHWVRENKSASVDEKNKAYNKIWKDVRSDLKNKFGW